MLANKLEEMKKRLLLQSQLKKENPENFASPRLIEEPLIQPEPPAEITA